ncbi:MAG: Zn-dependent hydrolase [Candidatus Puniceispirillales bacterium]
MAEPVSNIRINSDRLWDMLMDMAKIGPGVAGGNNRQALTDADADGRQLFADWCHAEGLTMDVDELGNMFMTRPGQNNDLPPILVGSHLDTQPTGGKYDGVLGVLAGLELIRTLNDHDYQTQHPICIVNWTNEEGTRFAPAMLSSGVFAKEYDKAWAYSREDSDGLTFGDELERIGWKGDQPIGEKTFDSYFELHIEQGPILELEDKDIGVVAKAQGLCWLKFTITGNAAHTGSTPMSARKDAGLAMARIINQVNAIVTEEGQDAVGAVGHMQITPNSYNVIPGWAQFTVDFRAPQEDSIKRMVEHIQDYAKQLCANSGLGLEMERISGHNPVVFDADCTHLVRQAADELGYRHRDMVSGAGHDACWLNKVMPSTMIFCPCKDGLSHNEAEDITPEWAAAGSNVLLHAVLKRAKLVTD